MRHKKGKTKGKPTRQKHKKKVNLEGENRVDKRQEEGVIVFLAGVPHFVLSSSSFYYLCITFLFKVLTCGLRLLTAHPFHTC